MLKEIIRKITPQAIQVIHGKYEQYQLKNKIVKYLKNASEFEELEKQKIIKYLTDNPLAVFPYDFTKKYNVDNIKVYTDDDCEMKYVLHENKRLYFKKNWEEKKIQNSYIFLLLEQDIDSPHRYETADFCVTHGDIVVDAGVAEGNFALSIVEKVEKLYLFEADEEWIEALEMTFAPWKEKVEITCKYISDNDGENCITLDRFLGKRKINFIKADIEGEEMAFLKGSQHILSNTDKLKIVMCTYHNQDDAKDINQLLTNYNFTTEFSKGYMFFLYDDDPLIPPYLRKGVIRAKK